MMWFCFRNIYKDNRNACKHSRKTTPRRDSVFAVTVYLFFLLLLVGETESTWYCGHYWSIVPAPDDR
jgi:hypothetical protein